MKERRKVLVVGDPHGAMAKIRKLPKKGIDLVICTGDVGKANLARQRFFENIERKKQGLPELEKDKKYIRDVWMEIHDSSVEVMQHLTSIAPTYTIQGNVGMPTPGEARKEYEKHKVRLPSTYSALQKMGVGIEKNRLRVLDDLRVGFLEYYTDTSWVREFKPADYAKRMKSAKKQTDKARRVLSRFDDLDIFVCHQPPYGHLDQVGPPAPAHWHGKHAGGKAILDYIKKHQPPYVFCGHIHEGEGETTIGKSKVYNLGVGGYKVIEV